MTLVTNRDSEDSRPRECGTPLVGDECNGESQEYTTLCEVILSTTAM